MSKNLNISLLRTFVAVAELGQITRAAAQVNVSQSAASQQISRLEDQLGVCLLQRSSNKVKLSTEGEQLYANARKLLALNDRIVTDVMKAREVVEIRFGVPHDIVERVSPPIVKKFCAENPNVFIQLLSMSTNELLDDMAKGKIDLLLATEPMDTTLGEVMMVDSLVWVGAQGARALEVDPLPVSLGDSHDRFSQVAIDALNEAGLRWRQINQPDGLGSVLAMLAAGMVVAPFLSKMLPAGLFEIKESRLPNLPQFQVNLIIRPHENRTIVLNLAAHVEAYFNEMTGKAI
ncbi:LysR family transcriptional regulator [Puniceibacterium sediminis]|uniref:DNA-binding transcriptional regulator, LysR family n=1 Tax=Puniceibacterium sediminis TaxID=1608407 RepID=A0A238ZUB8_9RHOB|nr:LysR family transcriptional regulator [Puniceibacterium sediminis]SNR86508.1 DNA-binding transcriptional regulator, LysR family [Puniceibacterium sediminis]